MATEIERKFLVKGDVWQPPPIGVTIRQGYLVSGPDRAVRVRVADRNGFLTVKAVKSEQARFEYEYPIPLADADEMLDRLCERPLIEKVRYTETVGDCVWVVDVFAGDNTGLVVAEVELEHEDQAITLPGWAGAEVTRERRYLNASLIRYPYRQWTPAERQPPGGRS